MKSPAITTTLEGKNKTLYLQVKCSFFIEKDDHHIS